MYCFNILIFTRGSSVEEWIENIVLMQHLIGTDGHYKVVPLYNSFSSYNVENRVMVCKSQSLQLLESALKAGDL